MLKAARYRVGQFFRALTAHVSEKEIEQAVRILTPQAQVLFRHQAVQDQYHALAVYRSLQKSGDTNPHLLVAALLHDIGKSDGRLSAVHRAIIVLLARFAPRFLTSLGQGVARGWRRAFVVQATHPELGAGLARVAGCSPLTTRLIQRHHGRLEHRSSEEDQLLFALQGADNLD